MFDHPRSLVCAGGASGGGKTHLLIMAALYYASYHASIGVTGCIGAICADTYENLRDRVLATFIRIASHLGDYVANHKEYGRCWIWKDARLGVVLLRNMQELDSFRGKEWDFLFVDELSTHPMYHNGEKILQLLRIPLRSSQRDVKCRPVLAASNWDGEGMSWMKRAWWDLVEKPETWNSEVNGQGWEADQFFYVPFGIDDNPVASFVQSYKPQLEALQGALRESRLLGKPTRPTGALFKDFELGVQTFRMRDKFPNGFPAHWPLYVFVDWGVSAPFGALWAALDEEGNLWSYRERYERNCDSGVQATMIRDGTGFGEVIQDVFTDPTMWNTSRDRQTLATIDGPIADYKRILLADSRFKSISKGDNSSRKALINHLQARLSVDRRTVTPKWFIEEMACPNAIAEIEDALQPETDEEDRRGIRKGCADHLLTAFGYGGLRLENDRAVKPVAEPIRKVGFAIKEEDDSDQRNDSEEVDYVPRRGGW